MVSIGVLCTCTFIVGVLAAILWFTYLRRAIFLLVKREPSDKADSYEHKQDNKVLPQNNHNSPKLQQDETETSKIMEVVCVIIFIILFVIFRFL